MPVERATLSTLLRLSWPVVVARATQAVAAACAALALASTPLIGPALSLLDFTPNVRSLMTDYMTWRMLAMGGAIGVEVLGGWYAGLGNTRAQMSAGLLVMTLNVALNWVLIEGHLGAPALGVRGAALASVIATWAGLALLLLRFVRDSRRAGAAGPLRISEMKRMLRFGVPNGLNWFFEFAAFIVFINVVFAALGTLALGAFMVVINVNSVAFMPAFGISSGGAILAGQAIGAGHPDDVPHVLKLTAATAAVWQLAAGAVYVLLPGQLIALFRPPGAAEAGELLRIGTTLLSISAAWQLFDAIAMATGEVLRAAGDTRWTLLARLVVAWALFTSIALLLVRVLGAGPAAATWCVVGYLAALALAFGLRFRGGRWREIDLVGDPAS